MAELKSFLEQEMTNYNGLLNKATLKRKKILVIIAQIVLEI